MCVFCACDSVYAPVMCVLYFRVFVIFVCGVLCVWFIYFVCVCDLVCLFVCCVLCCVSDLMCVFLCVCCLWCLCVLCVCVMSYVRV